MMQPVILQSDTRLEQCITLIQQTVDSYLLCPVSIYQLIAQFVIPIKCKLWYISCNPFMSSSGFISRNISYLNEKINWCDYPINKGDLVSIHIMGKVALFNGKILIDANFIRISNGNSCLTISEEFKFDILKDFYVGYWSHIPCISIYAYIDLSNYMKEINERSAVLPNPPPSDYHIKWSYFIYHGNITMIYSFMPVTCTLSLVDIINNSNHMYGLDDSYNSIIECIEKHTSIYRDYCLYIDYA